MFELTPQLMLQAGSTIAAVFGAYYALKYKLDAVGQKVDAVHKRIDEFEDQFNTLDKLVSNHGLYIADLRAHKHREGDTMNAFKMAKELLQEERADRG